MKNKTYDILKYIAQIVLPGLGALYAALSPLWGLPYAEAIVGTIAAVDAFLGALLQISSDKYYKSGKDLDGTLYIDDSGNEEKYFFDISEASLDELTGKHLAKLSIVKGALPKE